LKPGVLPWLFGAAMLASPSFAAAPVTRVKAKLVSFDGAVLTLQPATGAPFSVSILPDTRYVGSAPVSFAAIRPGSYAGAAVSEGRDGLRAVTIYLYADALRGTGEGRFPEGDRLLVNGAVSAVKAAQDRQDASLTIHYRGAGLSQRGKGSAVCEGRATPAPYASLMACEADAVIAVASNTPISALTVGDKSLLTPGSMVTVSMTKLADGKAVAPGLVVEGTVEKPQSPE
jgi:hypothetical protein